ncbi:hypothetical protein Peur_050107 [Populus x canadensis]
MHTRFMLCMYYLRSRCLWLWIFVVYAFHIHLFLCCIARFNMKRYNLSPMILSLNDFLSYLIPYSVLFTLLLSMFSIIGSGSDYISMYCTIDSHDVSCT